MRMPNGLSREQTNWLILDGRVLTSSHEFRASAGRNTPYTCCIGCVVIKLKNCRPQLNQALTRRMDGLRARTFVTFTVSNAHSDLRHGEFVNEAKVQAFHLWILILIVVSWFVGYYDLIVGVYRDFNFAWMFDEWNQIEFQISFRSCV